MIIDSPGIQIIAVGSGRVIPQDGDAQVLLPATILPTVDMMQQTFAFVSSNGNDAGSNCTSLTLIRNNQAGITSQLQLMPKGMYDIEVMLSSTFDFTPAVPAIGAHVRFGLGTSVNRNAVIAHWARVGSQCTTGRFRVLSVSEIVFDLAVIVTGVAENAGVTATLNAVRII